MAPPLEEGWHSHTWTVLHSLCSHNSLRAKIKLNEKILRVKEKKKITRRPKNISQKEVAPFLHQPSSRPPSLSSSIRGIPTSLNPLRIITSSKLFHTLLHLILTMILFKKKKNRNKQKPFPKRLLDCYMSSEMLKSRWWDSNSICEHTKLQKSPPSLYIKTGDFCHRSQGRGWIKEGWQGDTMIKTPKSAISRVRVLLKSKCPFYQLTCKIVANTKQKYILNT